MVIDIKTWKLKKSDLALCFLFQTISYVPELSRIFLFHFKFLLSFIPWSSFNLWSSWTETSQNSGTNLSILISTITSWIPFLVSRLRVPFLPCFAPNLIINPSYTWDGKGEDAEWVQPHLSCLMNTAAVFVCHVRLRANYLLHTNKLITILPPGESLLLTAGWDAAKIHSPCRFIFTH